MRAPIWIALTLLVVIGAGLCVLATRWPVYTDPNAPSRLSDELEPKLDADAMNRQHADDEAFKEWFARLRLYETPHKRVSDWGRGLIAAGLGFACAYGYLIAYERFTSMRTRAVIGAVWLGLWAARVPFAFWYYGLRENRLDYPGWGDSIAIPLFSEILTDIVGAIVSLVALSLLLKHYSIPSMLRSRKPATTWDWIRTGILAFWIAFLLFLVASAIPDGDEGVAFICIIAAAILFVWLCAEPATPQIASTPDLGATHG